jgi:hypothetical protein
MKLSKMTLLVVGLSLAAGSTARAQSGWGGNDQNQEQKVKLLGTIAIPGNPIPSTDIVWADQTTAKVLVSDRSNAGVDVINGRTDLFVGRVSTNGQATSVPPAAAGTLHFQGLTSPSTHEGPNGVVTTPDKKGWAGDGDSTVKVIDLDPSSPTYLQIIAQINTAGLNTTISNCTGGPTGTCNRADEIAYDPEQNIIVVANDEPTGIQPYVTFISASAPYTVLGQINFAAQGEVASGGLEQPAYDTSLHAYLQTVPVTDSTTGTGSIVVYRVKPSPFTVTVVKTISTAGFDCSPTGEALGEDEHLVVACSRPGAATGTPTSFPLVIDILTGNEIGAGITQVGGGDEVNFNPGENEFIVSSNVDGISTNPDVLGVINGKTGDWIENSPDATAASGTTAGTGGLVTSGRAGNLAAFGGNRHVFVVIHPATAPATDICGKFSGVDQGCVAVFGAVGPKKSDNDDRGRDDQSRNDRGRDDDHGFGGFHF